MLNQLLYYTSINGKITENSEQKARRRKRVYYFSFYLEGLVAFVLLVPISVLKQLFYQLLS